ncbi:MAG TPA: hypothetical protein VFL42_09440 [Terriglobales bacterium]|nr:hypothetical protein [Terriglobales bacterium]
MSAASEQDIYTTMRDWKWSAGEKAIARKTFEQALEEELRQTVAAFKDRSARVKDASELWKIEDWLAERRKDIDQKYDYRYSVLGLVFERLVREARVKKDDLRGLSADKLEMIRRVSEF